jgi:hypothetical protein
MAKEKMNEDLEAVLPELNQMLNSPACCLPEYDKLYDTPCDTCIFGTMPVSIQGDDNGVSVYGDIAIYACGFLQSAIQRAAERKRTAASKEAGAPKSALGKHGEPRTAARNGGFVTGEGGFYAGNLQG